MLETNHRLFRCCPNCGAAWDFDTPTARHYECGTRGDFETGTYKKRCEETKHA